MIRYSLLALILMYFGQVWFGTSVGGLFSFEYQNAPWSIGKFLDLLAKTGKVADSARAVGFTTTAFLHTLRREDEDFAELWDQAIDAAGDVLEAEAHRRAVEGIVDDVYYKGEVVGHKLLYSDQLLMFLLRGTRPEKYNQSGGGAQINVKFGVAVLPMTAPSEAEW